MTSASAQNLRADAARNFQRIVDAADRVFSRRGSNGSFEEIAVEAQLGIATVYRRFPTREALVKAVLDRHFTDVMLPELERAQREPDPRTALVQALEAGVKFASREQVMLAAAANIGLMTMDMAYKFFEPVSELIRRGQATGAFRADLVPEDTPRLVLMIAGTLPSFDPASEGWRRYLDIVVDGLAPGAHNTQLAPPSPVRDHYATLPTEPQSAPRRPNIDHG
jgi:AcrR family transcriptional regulator